LDKPVKVATKYSPVRVYWKFAEQVVRRKEYEIFFGLTLKSWCGVKK
jgi:hypothetical protein